VIRAGVVVRPDALANRRFVAPRDDRVYQLRSRDQVFERFRTMLEYLKSDVVPKEVGRILEKS